MSGKPYNRLWSADHDAVIKSLWALRDDAEARGMDDVTMAYGWSIIRRQHEVLVRMSKPAFSRAVLFPKWGGGSAPGV